MAITNKQIYDMLVEVRDQVKKLNGNVRTNTTDIAVLQEKVNTGGRSWDKLVGIGTAILTALILAKLIVP